MRGGERLVLPANGLPGEPPASCPGFAQYTQIMERCWAQRAESRPSFTEVVRGLRALLEMQGDGPEVGHAAPLAPGPGGSETKVCVVCLAEAPVMGLLHAEGNM